MPVPYSLPARKTLETCMEWESRSLAEFPFAAQSLPRSTFPYDMKRNNASSFCDLRWLWPIYGPGPSLSEGKLFSLTLASGSGALSEGAILQQFVITCSGVLVSEDRGCLAAAQEQKSKSGNS